MSLSTATDALEAQLVTLEDEASKIRKALSLLKSTPASGKPKRHLSPEAIEKIRKAALKRWAVKKKTPKKINS